MCATSGVYIGIKATPPEGGSMPIVMHLKWMSRGGEVRINTKVIQAQSNKQR